MPGQKLWQKVSTIVSQKSGSKIFDKLLYASLFSFDIYEHLCVLHRGSVCDYNFDACLLRRVQNYQKRQIAWFEPRHKALVLIPNINERLNWSNSLYILHVTCYMLHVTCYMFHVTCYMFNM